jgi:hypothetical protein
MRKSNRRLSDTERAERRRANRERLQVATEALPSSEGWSDGCAPAPCFIRTAFLSRVTDVASVQAAVVGVNDMSSRRVNAVPFRLRER